MSSLRLALKQSLQESGSSSPKKTKERKLGNPQSLTGTPNHSMQSLPLRHRRRPGDPPRKRGRPRKHPLPEQPKEEKRDGEHNPNLNNDDADQSSDENEFSDSESFENTEDASEQASLLTRHDQDDAEDDCDDDTGTQGDYDGVGDVSTVDHDEVAARRKQKNLLKKIKQENLAANTIQKKLSEWSKNKITEKATPRSSSPKPPKKKSHFKNVKRSDMDGLKAKRSAKGIVPAPSPKIVDWISSMSTKKQRRNMSPGLRVKVRFATKVKKRDGKIVNKYKWYGGLVIGMSLAASKIKIKYDDSTLEVAKFPDDDIIVDDQDNDCHQAPADAFIPPSKSDYSDAVNEGTLEEKSLSVQSEETNMPELTPCSNDVPDDSKSDVNSIPRVDLFEQRQEQAPDVELAGNAVTHDENVAIEGCAENTVHQCSEQTGIPFDKSGHLDHQDAQEFNSDNADSSQEYQKEDEKDGYQISQERGIVTGSPSEKLHRGVGLNTDENSDESSDDDGPMEVIAEGKGAEISATGETSDEEDSDNREDDDRSDVKDEQAVFDDETSQLASDDPEADNRECIEEERTREEHDIGELVEAQTVEYDAGKCSKGVLNAASDELDFDDNDDEEVDDDVTTNEFLRNEQVNEDKSPEHFHRKSRIKSPRPVKRKREAHNSVDSNSGTTIHRQAAASRKKRSSPLIILSEFNKEPIPSSEVAKPVSTLARSMLIGNQGEERLNPDSPRIVSSHNSAFDRKETIVMESKLFQTKDSEQSIEEAIFGQTPNQDSSDLSSGQRSGRRAAQQANERIASRQEMIITESNTKPKKKKVTLDKLETKLPGKKIKDAVTGDDGVDGENQWVQCDLCAKWRVLPSTVDVDKLPNQWYCEMNTYDPLHNSCDATEQTPEEIAKAKRKAKRRLARRARLEAEAAASLVAPTDVVIVESKEKEVKTKPGLEKRKREEKPLEEVRKRSSPTSNISEEDGKNSSGSNSDSDLPKESKKTRRSRIKEDDVLGDMGDGLKGKVRGRIRRGKDGKDAKDDKVKGRKGSNKGKEDNQEWVQCEKCEKWRRLPPHISADDLPDVWYCSMNSWDPNTSTCGAAEDKADPSSHIVPGISGIGGHKLSYRNLIFGTGKKHHRPISERMRAAESLFSSNSFADPDTAGTFPTVMYANSSMFINRSNAARVAEEKNKERMTFLELMGHSNMWAELRGVDRRFSSQGGVQHTQIISHAGKDITPSSAPDEWKNVVKEMIYHALGNETWPCHKILLEIQCGTWEGIPETWTHLRSVCTIDMVVACILELVKEGRVEVVHSTKVQLTILDATPSYRRVTVSSHASALTAHDDHHQLTRCMKIAKPWKHGVDIFT